MIREDILRMAEESGIDFIRGWYSCVDENLERFAKFVADAKESQILDLLKRLHEEHRDRHNYYQHAINAIKEAA